MTICNYFRRPTVGLALTFLFLGGFGHFTTMADTNDTSQPNGLTELGLDEFLTGITNGQTFTNRSISFDVLRQALQTFTNSGDSQYSIVISKSSIGPSFGWLNADGNRPEATKSVVDAVHTNFPILKITDSTFWESESEFPSSDFRQYHFASRVDFSGSIFRGKTSFAGDTFAGNAKFANVVFQGDVDFSHSTFKKSAIFGNAAFSTNNNSLSAHFDNFSDATFEQVADFLNSEFGGHSSFSAAHFMNRSVFQKARFDNFADFGLVEFSKKVDFSAAHFLDVAFWGTHFGGQESVFTSATFGGASFESFDKYDYKLNTKTTYHTIFDSPADFDSCVFTNQIALGDVWFNLPVNFANANFLAGAQFSRVIFNGCNFKNASFSGSTDFELDMFTNTYRLQYDDANADSVSFVGTHFNNVNFTEVNFYKGLPAHLAYPSDGGELVVSTNEFYGKLSFARCVFTNLVCFINTRFQMFADFNGAQFLQNTIVNHSSFGAGVDFSDIKSYGTFAIDFTSMADPVLQRAEFFQGVSFRSSVWTNEFNLYKAMFHGDVTFKNSTGDADDGRRSSLCLDETHFSGHAYLDNMNFDDLVVDGDISPVAFEREAYFRNSKIKTADFNSVEFEKDAHFEWAAISNQFSLTNVFFQGSLNLNHAFLPPKSKDGQNGVFLDDQTLINGALILDWSQLKQPGIGKGSKLVNPSSDDWQKLEDAFRRSANLEGANNAMYQFRLLQRVDPNIGFWNKLWNYLLFTFWGYGVRPLRVMFWMLFMFAIDFRSNLTHFRSLAESKMRDDLVERLLFTLNFTWQTSIGFSFKFRRSAATRFKVFTLIYSIAFKTVGFFFLTALSNVNPLLNALLSKTFGV